ncbi:phasin family protein [bacterium]|nr:phasin family protein [bacterium]
MLDLLKRTVLTGLGFAYLTKDKVMEAGKKIAKEAKLSEDEGKKFLSELVTQTEKARKNVEAQVEEFVKKKIDKYDVATKKDLEKLEKKIAALEKKLAAKGKK